MTYQTILTSVDDEIGIIQLNRPKAMNSVDAQLLEELIKALEEMEQDSDTRVIVITGNEKVFAAGADIRAAVSFTPFEAREFLNLVHRTIFKIEENSKPIIAAVCGFALGGGMELVLACDIKVVAEDATLGLPEINLGIYPGGGGTQRLPRLIGMAHAKELILTGELFTGKKAFEMGMVNHLVPAGEVLDTAKKVARTLASKPPLALKLAKSAMNSSMNSDIKTGCQIEQDGWAMLFASEDQKEGMQAFLNNRKPVFRGR